jgi:hypothetical protein
MMTQEIRDHKLYALYLEDDELYAIKDDNGKYTFNVSGGKNRIYFGITMKTFENRISKHITRMNDVSYPYSQKLYNCLRLYGFDNFKKIVIEDGLTGEEAKALEIYHIEKYDTYKKGLNSTRGGDSFAVGEYNTSASAVKIYNNITGEIRYFTWQGSAAEFLAVHPNRIGLVANPKFTTNSQLYSHKFDAYFQIKYAEDTTSFIENMPTPNEKVAVSRRNKIIVVDLDTRIEQEFDCIGDAAKHLKTEEHNINNVLNFNDKCQQFKAGTSRYDVQKLPKTRDWNFNILPTNKLIALANSKKIYYVDADGKEVVFDSRKEASNATCGELSISYQAGFITKSIQSDGQQKCAAGYYWYRK